MSEERTLVIACAGQPMIGLLHMSAQPGTRAMLIVVGGPQYRVGSHRQFVLLARHMANGGIPVLRFDCRGMGDSAGEPRGFEDVDEDIRCAIDALFAQVPGLRDVVIWGLCDAASAALFYALRDDRRVSGLVLVNPWVRTEAGMAQAYLRHYYLAHLLDAALWKKIARGEFEFCASIRSFAGMLFSAVATRNTKRQEISADADSTLPAHTPTRKGRAPAFPARMLLGFQSFKGRVLLILSGEDLTAAEFRDLVAASGHWRRLLRRNTVTRQEFPAANHTFARREWRDQVAIWTSDWIRY